jgi:outer membrane protein OmpA-like peptidoglycan-associated protein
MNSRFVGVTALAVVLAAAPVAAQSAGTLEIGGFGRMTWFDSKLGLEDGGGFGGRLGIFAMRNLAIEGDMSYTSVPASGGNDVTLIPIHAGLTYNFPVGEHTSFLLGGRYVHNKYGKDADISDNGFGGVGGIRLGLGETASIRLEFTADRMSNSDAVAGDSYWNYGANAGLSLMLGGRHGVKDGDKDGVPDSADACLDTPAGDAVDGRGCSLPKDADKDGVVDSADRCPDTPTGDRVDANGCSLPKDADNDGVMDTADRCPNTPAGDRVDANGCSLPKDGDNDGVMDNVDRCLNTPAGDKVDANGCSLPKDSDNDGVADPNDQCPNTAAGAKVDSRGCPQLFQEQQTTLILEGVTFETAKAVLTPEAKVILDKVAESLVANPEVRVEVAGYTDSRGARAYNVRLSQDRAASVRAYLVEKGVAADRMTAKGYGPDSPVDSNATDAGRARNRRVELHKLN